MNLLLKLTELSPKFNPLTKASNFGMPFCFFRPNIESFKQYVPAWMEYPGGGVIEWESLGAGPLVGGGSGGPFPCEMTLDASRGSAEYVTGASLQPSAIQVLACIKF